MVEGLRSNSELGMEGMERLREQGLGQGQSSSQGEKNNLFLFT